jgi:hypothetical protein
LSPKAELNRSVLVRIQAALEENPEIELFANFPRLYKGAVAEQKQLSATPDVSKEHNRPGRANFCADLVARARAAEVVYPLSEETTGFLSGYMDPESESQDLSQSLVYVLSQMILTCERLWEFPTRGVVLKCTETLAAKIIRGNSDYTEYTSIQYLSEKAGDLPFPKPHGLVKFDSVRVMFMTYFPSMTLEAAWPKLTHEDKCGIQSQLNDIFLKLRALPSDGHTLGGVCGEGVQDHHRDSHSSRETMTTAAQFEEFQFSIPRHGDASWIKFLRTLLPPAESPAVFTHGDFRAANIMVDVDENGRYSVTGVIDWETSGFYPAWFESSRVLYLSVSHEESDWWRYIPACIAPATNPERWLVGRLRDQFVRSN